MYNPKEVPGLGKRAPVQQWVASCSLGHLTAGFLAKIVKRGLSGTSIVSSCSRYLLIHSCFLKDAENANQNIGIYYMD